MQTTADMPRMPPQISRGNKPYHRPNPPDPSLLAKFNKPEPAKLRFEEGEISPKPNDLELIVCQNSLPQLVQVTQEFKGGTGKVFLKAGDIIMLHMIVAKKVVHAIDEKGKDLYLPIEAEQVYERLTTDDRVDDRLYIGVKALLEANILPPMVRVIENYHSADPSECVDDEDILELHRVGIAPEDKRHRGRMCVYGKNQQGYDLYLHEGMMTAHFTTKLSANFHPMTELIELGFPQRVRIPSKDPNRPNIKEEKIYKLLGVEKEFHVIMTQPGRKGVQVFAIPSRIPIKMSLVTGNYEHVSKALPPIYALLNPTWHVKEIGRNTLTPPFQQLPQPVHDVFKPWMHTFEGKKCVKEALEIYDTETKRQFTDLKNEVDMWKNLYDTVKSTIPEIPIRQDVPPPPRPPKPKQPTSPITEEKPASPKQSKKNYVIGFIKKSGMKLSTRVKSPTTSEPPTSPTNSLDLSYEQPMNQLQYNKLCGEDSSEDDENYEEISEDLIKESKDLKKLKQTIESQNEIIEVFRKKETELKRELRDARNKNEEHVHKIYTLQQEIETLLNKEDGIYDIINEDRPLPPPPNAMQHIYNTASAGATPGMKVTADQLQTYTVAGVEKFLKEIKLEKHSTNFRIEGIDGALLLALDETMLMELGMSALDARRLYVRIGKTPGK